MAQKSPGSPRPRRLRLLQVAVAYVGFATLGLSTSLRGVAWPSIQAGFGLPLGAVGLLITVATAGSILASSSGGLVAARIGVGPLLAISSTVTALGLLGYGVAPTWWLMVLAGLISGAGSGAMHVALNAHFAANHGAGVINWLHGCFGVGATIGPMLLTAILQAGSSWRWGYGVASAVMGLVALYFTFTTSRWRGSREQAGDTWNQNDAERSLHTLRLPVVWLILLVFFTYTGVESTAGQWCYSLFTEARSITESAAGFWMSVYWGGLAAGRLLVGGVANRLKLSSLLRLCIFYTIVGAALIWWHATDLLSFLGLALMGLAEGPIFPSLVSGTPRRVGAGHADNVIGFQVAAASLGVAALSSLAGILADSISLEIIGPFLVVGAALMFLFHEVIARRARP